MKKWIIVFVLTGVFLICYVRGLSADEVWIPSTMSQSEDASLHPMVALTFDDGPHPVWTEYLLDGLAKAGVKASFFVIGENVRQNQEIIKRMHQEGHLIGNHTYTHMKIQGADDCKAKEEILRTSECIREITGEGTQFVRPPYGLWEKELEYKIGMLPVFWTVDPLDWTTQNISQVVNIVVTEVEENDIILLHDCYESSVKAALEIVDCLQKKGYRFVTVDQLLLD